MCKSVCRHQWEDAANKKRELKKLKASIEAKGEIYDENEIEMDDLNEPRILTCIQEYPCLYYSRRTTNKKVN